MSLLAITNFSVKIFTINNIICMGIASLFMGSIYPLTQIYQHQADKNDGVISISYKLGYMGTFIFSVILFSIATVLLFYFFDLKQQPMGFILFLVVTSPVVAKLSIWFNKVRKDTKHADFENTMAMNLLTSTCMNIYFLLLILNNHFTWF
jgi:1,4-dihydroxy-2-naphthoate octaprenyltransferase